MVPTPPYTRACCRPDGGTRQSVLIVLSPRETHVPGPDLGVGAVRGGHTSWSMEGSLRHLPCRWKPTCGGGGGLGESVE